MRPEARRCLKNLRWLAQADRYLELARRELQRNPDDRQLHALVRLMEQVVAHERARVIPASVCTAP